MACVTMEEGRNKGALTKRKVHAKQKGFYLI